MAFPCPLLLSGLSIASLHNTLVYKLGRQLWGCIKRINHTLYATLSVRFYSLHEYHFLPPISCPLPESSFQDQNSLPSLHLTDNLVRSAKRLDHLLTLLAPALGVVTLFQEVIQLTRPVHLLEKLALHFVFGESVDHVLAYIQHLRHSTTYCTRVNMIAFGTMSIIVRRTML